MSVSLINALIEMSKQMHDYWAGTTTGAGSATTVVDTALMAKENDWIGEEAYVFLTEEPAGDAAIYDERKASSLNNTTGTITTLAFAAAPGTGIDYQIHRLATPSEKRIALIAACRRVFPDLFDRVLDESHVTGNWLKDGSFESWTSSSALDYWTTDTVTLTQNSSSPYYVHGVYSAKLDTSAGNISQSITDFDDLKYLANKWVEFTLQGYCDTASCLRIAIYDGTTYTYSDYHAGNSAFNVSSTPMKVKAQISSAPTTVQFIVYHDVAGGTSYVDDSRVISGYRNRVWIGDLNLVQDKPHQVLYSRDPFYSQREPWVKIHGIRVDEAGYMSIPGRIPTNRTMRIRGVQYLDFLSSGVSSTDWTATVNVTTQELDVIVAEAILYVYQYKSLPNDDTADREMYKEMIAFWELETEKRKRKYFMVPPGATQNWGFN